MCPDENILRYQRSRFDSEVAELRATQGEKVIMFSDVEYYQYIEKVKEIRTLGHKMFPT